MHIDKYKQEDDSYIIDDVYHEDIENALTSGICNFCGCGNPKDALKYVGKVLRLIYTLQTDVWDNKLPYDDWSKLEKKLFPVKGSEYFAYYWLDNMELTEHGGSVPGWLVDKGIELMEDIEELYGYN